MARLSRTGGRLLVAGSAIALVVGVMSNAVTAAQAQTAPSQSVTSFVKAYFHATDRTMLPQSRAVRSEDAAVAAMSRFYPTGTAATATSQALFAYQVQTAGNFLSWVHAHGYRYKSFSTRPTILNMRLSASGQRASVKVETMTTFEWSSAARPDWSKFTKAKAASVRQAEKTGRYYGPNQLVTSIVETTHRMTLIRQGNIWKVGSDWYLDPFNQTVGANHLPYRATTTAAPSRRMTSTATARNRQSPDTASVVVETYDRSGAAAYADHYYSSYNTEFPNCNIACGGGGDCTNFISQALSYYGNIGSLGQGGDLAPEHHSTDSVDLSWQAFYNGATSLTLPWDNANDSRLWVTGNPWGAGYDFGHQIASGSESAVLHDDKDDMSIGDLHYYHWNGDTAGANHAAIVVAYGSDGQTLVDAHHTNAHRVNWDLGDSGTTYYLVGVWDRIDVPLGS